MSAEVTRDKDGSNPFVDASLMLALFAGIAVYLFTAIPGYFSLAQGGDYPQRVATTLSLCALPVAAVMWCRPLSSMPARVATREAQLMITRM